MNRFRILSVLVVAFALLASACGDAASNKEVVSVEGRVLTEGKLDELLPSGDATVPSRVAAVIEDWLLTHVLELEIIDRGETLTETDYEEAELFVESLRLNERVDDEETLVFTYALSLAVGRWAEAEAEARPDPEPPMMLCSNHILLDAEADALVALDRYENGEAFDELAIELSTGPSGPSGGDLGCQPEGQFVPEFEEAAYAAEAGDVVGPVQTQFGWHLIEIVSVGPATAENHPDADPTQFDLLAGQGNEALLTEIIEELEAEAKAAWGDSVTVDPSLGTFDAETFTVTVTG